ncbi:phage tail length tape measure family protein [Rhizobium sp. 16-449-1b]|uniref:phage tail length tape measure family protein n=1 Tax=Rhizobium sp. 16-449-1b TaxID=2819989 RepID=UPI001ADA64F4|nr:phage tail length tape measure family protein [Rhizobium sp. 16-449-1b]MBO9194324.1 phage tail length tape measure family protein [Rhizobium sp. 16-449-1b]
MADNTDDLIISISTDQATLRRSIKRIEADLGALAGSVKRQFDTVGKSIDNSISSSLQKRIEATVGIGTKSSKEWTGALADQGKELERLRARYSPLFATINNYKQAVTDIRRAHAIGAISANEMAAAISKERQAALASTAAIKGRNAALAATPSVKPGSTGAVRGFETANIAAQFQDIAVSATYGNPIQVALQQGTQLSSILGQMENPIKGIGAAFMSIVSPVSLVTIGAIAAGVAAFQYFTSTEDEADKAADALKNHSDLIRRIKEAWPEAAEGLKDYAAESKRILMQDTKDSVELYKSAIVDAAKDAKSPLLSIPASDFQGATETIRLVQVAIGQLDTGIKAGNPNLRAFIEQLIEIENQSGTPENIKELIKEIREAAKAGLEAQAKLDPLTKTVEGVGLAAAATAKNIDLFVKAVDKLADISPPPLADITKAQKAYDDALKAARTEADVRNAEDALAAAKKRISDQNPTVTDGDGRTFGVPTPQSRPLVELEGLPGADKKDKKAETAATKAANAYRDLLKSASDRIGQVQQEIELLGKYGVEADAARFALDLMQQSEDKGRSLSEAQRKEIEKKVELYKQYSETLAKAKLSQDLLQQQRFNSLSQEDQKVTTTLRQYGLSEDLNSQEAGQIRRSLRIDDARDELKSFFGDFKGALLSNGGDIGKAFGEAIQNALLNSASKMLDKIFDQLISGILGTQAGGSAAASGKGGLGAIIGAVGGSGGSSGSSGAVDKAFSLLGANEKTSSGSINSFLKSGGVDIDAAQTAWCAAFVNSSLSQVGVKGSGSLTANSFLNWGSSVDPSKLMRGDVLVQNRGLGAGQAGGHVGFATGETRAGGSQLQMLSGNLSNGVGTSWVDASSVQIRRASESLDKLATSSLTATDGLGSLGTGLGQLGSSLGGAGGGAASGGGLISWIGNLFGGVKTGGTAVAAFNTRGYSDGGHVTGEGGPTDDRIPAMLSNGEFVINSKATRKHRQLLEAINTGRVARFATGGLVSSRSIGVPMAPQLASTARPANENSAPGVLQVQISGANGDDHVRMLVKQGVGEGLSQYNENQRRGAFGQMQNRYTAQKG